MPISVRSKAWHGVELQQGVVVMRRRRMKPSQVARTESRTKVAYGVRVHARYSAQHPMSDPQPNVSRPIGYAGPRTGSAQATTTADGVPLASWWRRALAALIDILIVATIITIITFGVWRSLYAARGSATSTPCWMPRAKGSRRLR